MKDFLKGAALVVSGVIYAVGKTLIEENVSEERYSYCYSDAMKAITESDMDDFYKYKIMEMISKGEDPDYYGTVVSLVKSDMDTFYIYQTLKRINES